jgi:hypothetical protein
LPGLIGALTSDLAPTLVKFSGTQHTTDDNVVDDICRFLSKHRHLEILSVLVDRPYSFHYDEFPLELLAPSATPSSSRVSLASLRTAKLHFAADVIFRTFSFPNLTELTLKSARVVLSSLDVVFAACTRLTTLRLSGWCTLQSFVPLTANRTLTSLSLIDHISNELRRHAPARLANFVAAFPSLHYLELASSGHDFHNFFGVLTSAFECGANKQNEALRELRFASGPSDPSRAITITQAKRLLRALPLLVNLDLFHDTPEAARKFVTKALQAPPAERDGIIAPTDEDDLADQDSAPRPYSPIRALIDSRDTRET